MNLCAHEEARATWLRSRPLPHFSIPVSDIARSTRFYTEIVGCNHLSRAPRGDMAFLDAAGMCLTLVKRDPPINPHLRAHGVEITFEEDRQGGVLNGPAPIFTIPTARCWNLSDELCRQSLIQLGDYRFRNLLMRRSSSPQYFDDRGALGGGIIVVEQHAHASFDMAGEHAQETWALIRGARLLTSTPNSAGPQGRLYSGRH
jgi:catechol 2,3-dioxygenase-like lactoylglutathione lyase family enzyme